MTKFFFVLALVFFVVGSKSLVNAETIEVVGNGANSQNNINVQGANTTTTQQTTNTNITNDVNAKANTGGNSATGNTGGDSVIITGDSAVNVKVTNQGGSNVAKVTTCCGTPTPAPTKKPTTTPTPSGTPNNPSNGGNNGGSNGSSGGVGGGGSTSNNPQIIGLSKTAGVNNLQYLFYLSGLVCLGLGGKFLLKH